MERRRHRVARPWRVVVSVGVACVLGIGAWINTSVQATEEQPQSTTHSSRPSRTSTSSQEANVEAKLNEILQNQQKILTRLDEVMEELKIVKIRATLR